MPIKPGMSITPGRKARHVDSLRIFLDSSAVDVGLLLATGRKA